MVKFRISGCKMIDQLFVQLLFKCFHFIIEINLGSKGWQYRRYDAKMQNIKIVSTKHHKKMGEKKRKNNKISLEYH